MPLPIVPTILRTLLLSIIFALLTSFNPAHQIRTSITLHVLGTVQDAGSPHIGCNRDCCKGLFEDPDPTRMVASLGLVDHRSGERYLFEATPDFTRQLRVLSQLEPAAQTDLPNGIFLTHAHIGHYTGLMYLGKEAINASSVPVYAMPRMRDFLQESGPWSQLVIQQNIQLRELSEGDPVLLNPYLRVTPIQVPHRDEYSETVGYRIEGPNRSALFIPDIDKWDRWERSIDSMIVTVDYAFLDATFFSGEEIGYQDIRQIPHPFVIESLERFDHLTPGQKSRVHFIHLNHTNPLLDTASQAYQTVIDAGYQIAQVGQQFQL